MAGLCCHQQVVRPKILSFYVGVCSCLTHLLDFTMFFELQITPLICETEPSEI